MLKMAQSSSGKKVANGLVAAGTAAVLAVYAAGYARTSSAASQLDAQSSERRRPVPANGDSARVTPSAATSTSAPVASNIALPARGQSAANQQVASLTPASMPPAATPSGHQADVVNVPPTSNVSPTAPAPAPVAPAPVETAPVAAPPTPAPVATASVVPAPAPTAPAAPQAEAKWKDGTYTGWGTCRHGDIQAQVIIAGGRITSATIAQCLTRYSCDIIGRLPPQVLQRQSAEVDYVSGATQSANAFYYAVLEALGKAK